MTSRPATTCLTSLTCLKSQIALSPGPFQDPLQITFAMSLLHAQVDTAVIALWMGHADVRSTDPYLHADLAIKERALAMTTPMTVRPGRYRPPDSILAFLEDL
jgi:site-specific recombinase XerD